MKELIEKQEEVVAKWQETLLAGIAENRATSVLAQLSEGLHLAVGDLSVLVGDRKANSGKAHSG